MPGTGKSAFSSMSSVPVTFARSSPKRGWPCCRQRPYGRRITRPCCTYTGYRIDDFSKAQETLMGAQWKAKHKEIAANAKGRIFTKLTKEIMVAARNGPDPDMNPRLRLAVEQAKKASMTRETLERAIKKGSGQLDGGVNYEKVVYEGFAPHQVPVIVECLTDNVNRTISSMRVLFRKGQLASSGAVSWDFDHLGIIEASRASADADAELAAIEAGAQDFETEEDGSATFFTDATDLDLVAKALPDHG